MDGQLRYVRPAGSIGVLYVARGLADNTTYAWVPVALTASPTFTGTVTLDGITTTGATLLGNQSTDTHQIAGRIITDGSAPSISPNAVNTTGLGIGGTATISGNNTSGVIVLDPAGTPGAGTQATVTFFGIDRGSQSYGVWLTPDDADALLDDGKVRALRSSGTQWVIVSNAAYTNLNAKQWHYLIVENT